MLDRHYLNSAESRTIADPDLSRPVPLPAASRRMWYIVKDEN